MVVLRRGAVVLWCVLAWVGIARPARAQETMLPLSLEEALARAARGGPDAVLARREVVEAAAQRVGAGRVMRHNPVLSGYVGGFEDIGGPAVAWGGQLNQTFEIGGQRGARLREVDRRVEASQHRARAALVGLLAAVVDVYAQAGAGHERVAFARQAVAIADRVLVAARLRVQNGAASEIEVTLAEAERGRAGVALLGAERQERAALAALRGYLDLVPGAPVVLTTRVGRVAPTDTVATLVARARARRPDLGVLRAERAAALATDDRLAREAVPNPTIGAQVDYGVQQPPLYGVVFQLPIPLFERNQGERAVATARAATLDAALDILERRVAREVHAATEDFAARAREVEVYEEAILPAAVRTLDLVEAGWLAGRFDVFRVLAASRELNDARREYLNVIEALWQAWARLRVVTGEGS